MTILSIDLAKLHIDTADIFRATFQVLIDDGDTKVRLLNNRTLLELDYGPYDLQRFQQASRFPGGNYPYQALRFVNSSPESMIEAWGTPEYKDKLGQKLAETRQACRDHDYDAHPIDDVSGDLNQDAPNAIADVLDDQPGLLLGGEHGDPTHRAPIMEMLESGAMSAANSMGLLFVEEFLASVQPSLDAFFNAPPDAEMDGSLKTFLDKQTAVYKTDFRKMVELAKRNGVRVVGTDADEAKIYDDNCVAAHHEQRCAKQNLTSAKIMEDAIAAAPEGQKFVALIGGAHSNTHGGGVPGISQLMGVPAVTVDASGKLHQAAEDPAQRETVPEHVAQFVDQYMKQVYLKGDPTKNALLSWEETRAAALDMADFFVGLNALKPGAKIDTLVDNPRVQDHIETALAKAKKRSDRKKELIGYLEADPSNPAEFTNKLAQYHADQPDLLAHDNGQLGGAVLAAAVKTGNTAVLADCVTKGAPIADPKLAKQMFSAAVDRRESDAASMSAHDADAALTASLQAIVGAGADPNGRNRMGDTPLQMVIERGFGSQAGALIALGANAEAKTAPVAAKGDTAAVPAGSMIELAVRNKDAGSIDALITAGLRVDTLGADGSSLLQMALMNGDSATAKVLLAQGARLDLGGALPEADTLLHVAARIGDPDLIDALVDAGADPSVANAKGETAAKAILVAEVRRAIDESVNGNRKEAIRLADEIAQRETAIEEAQKQEAAHEEEMAQLRLQIDGRDARDVPNSVVRDFMVAAAAKQTAHDDIARLTLEKQALGVDLQSARDDDPMKDLIGDAETSIAAASTAVNDLITPIALAKIHVKAAKTDQERKNAETQLGKLNGQLAAAQRSQDDALRERDRLLQPQPIDDDLVQDAADSIAGAGVTSLDDIDTAMAKGGVPILVKELGRQMIERGAKAEALKTAIEANDLPTISDLIDETPSLVNALVTTNGKAKRSMLGLAASGLKPDAMAILLRNGADPNRKDSGEATPMHRLFDARQDDDDKKQLQRDMIAALVGAGASVDEQDRLGMTALHRACLDGNAHAIDCLLDNGANADITDKRGWKAEDVVIATTKPVAEKAFADKIGRPINPPLVQDDEDDIDTVTILLRATRCENPNDTARMEETYRNLYAQPAFRPMLDLLAADAAQAHVARGKDNAGDLQETETGLRIFIADFEQVGLLYNLKAGEGYDHPHSKSPHGAYEETAHIVHAGGGTTTDEALAGTLIHELTHCATRILYGAQDIPCPPPDPDADDGGYFAADGSAGDGVSADPYLAAIRGDAQRAAMFRPASNDLTSDDFKIYDTLFKRLESYTDKGDKALLQEYLVSVPQLIAQYGRDAVNRVAPKLVAYFEGGFTAACQQKITEPRYEDVLDKMDNRALTVELGNEGRPIVKTADHKMSANDSRASVDGIMKTLKDLYTAEHGEARKAGNVSLPMGPDNFEISDQRAIRTRDKLMDKLRAALSDAYGGADALPEQISSERLAALVDELHRQSKTLTGKQLKKAIQISASQFVRETRQDALEESYATGKNLKPAEMAELVLLRAQDQAWASANPGGDPRPVCDMKNHDALVAEMAAKFGDVLDPKDAGKRRVRARLMMDQANRDGFIREQVQALVNSGNALSAQAGRPVKIDQKKARRAWFAELRRIGLPA